MSSNEPGTPPAPSARRRVHVVTAIILVALLLVFRGAIRAWFSGKPAAGASASLSEGNAAPAGSSSTDGAPAGDSAGAAAAPGAPSAPGQSDEIAYYTCSMHPAVRQNGPGKCPICDMDLIPVRRAEAASGVVVLDDGRRQEIGIRTGLVERRRAAESIHAVGKVAFDESRLADVTVRVQGFAGRLLVSQVGQRVARGQVLCMLYSPEIYLAEREYLAALASQREARRTAVPDRADDLLAAAAQRLRLWEVDEGEITRLNERGEPDKEIPVRSPASGVVIAKDVVQGAAVQPGMKLYRIAGLDRVWVDAQVYQADLPRVRVGQQATVRLSALPERELSGRVALIFPTLDPASRTAQVRIALRGPVHGAQALLPDMVAEVELGAARGEVLVVPDGAVLYTGPRTLVFVDEGGGRFRSREVRLGARSGDVYTVLSGLAAGERVVTSGQFLLDAEGRLKRPAAGTDR
jgi:Cu(I)/Ag(I) efflux system membrane fusion protein